MTHRNESLPARPISLPQAVGPLVLALDIGSGSTRCCLYDAYARPVDGSMHTARHRFTERADGTSTISADYVTEEVASVITQTLDGLATGSVSAVAMDTFAASLICVDAAGNALTPCFTYADGRSAAYLQPLGECLDASATHQRTGARLHTSYHPARMLWLRHEFPDVWCRTATFLSLGEYIYSKIAGIHGAAISTLAWAGLLNRFSLAPDEEILDAVGVRPEKLAVVVDPKNPLTDVSPTVKKRWPALAGAAWFPAIPDGLASNLGVGAADPEVAALSAATSGAIRVLVSGTPKVLPDGLWCYSVSREHSIVGGALNDVGRVMLWLKQTFAALTDAEIEAALRDAPRDGTPLVLPFLTGERATGWAGEARAVFSGVSSATTSSDFWRGAAEGVAVSYARVFEQLKRADPALKRVIASGGVTQHYPGLMDMTAHAIGFPVHVADAQRVTMRGAAVMALGVINPGQPAAPIPQPAAIQPDPAQQPYYRALRQRFEKLYAEVVGSGTH